MLRYFMDIPFLSDLFNKFNEFSRAYWQYFISLFGLIIVLGAIFNIEFFRLKRGLLAGLVNLISNRDYEKGRLVERIILVIMGLFLIALGFIARFYLPTWNWN